MSSTSLNHKTVRPGSLLGYSYYHSSRTANVPPKSKHGKHKKRSSRSVSNRKLFIYLSIILVALLLVNFASKFTSPKPSSTTPVIATPAPAGSHVATPAVVPNVCASNVLDKHILVSVGRRHLYACAGGKSVYDSPVVTGISYLAADITPIGTYSIYAKQTDTDLVGSDSTGSWNDHVYYWMPFLQNQFGTYGLHDATWRNPKDFGNIDPNSSNASHGCVELPLAASKWLYNWVDIGTPITINS